MLEYSKIIKLRLGEKWCSKNSEISADVLKNIESALDSVFPNCVSVERRYENGFDACLSSDSFDRLYVEKVVRGIVMQMLSETDGELKSVEVCDIVPQRVCSQSATDRIENLVGSEEFKELAREIDSISAQIKKHRTFSVFANRSYLFSINDGCGLSTYLELLRDLMTECGVFRFAEGECIVEETLRQRTPAEMPDAYLGKLSKLKTGKINGALICVDISQWIGKTDDPDFRNMLSVIEDSTNDNIFVFRVPFIEGEVLQGVKNSLSDVLFIKEVSITPFDLAQLEECAERSFKALGYTMDVDAWEVFDTRIAEEKSDGRFYGINTVNKVVNEIVYRKLISNCESGSDDTVIKAKDIMSLALTYHQKAKTAEEMLSELVGMDDVKEKVLEIINQIKVSLQNDIGSPCLHMQFVGNPGTGKTTVARIVGKLLKEAGVLRNGGFFEYTGRDFCGKFIGETAPKTASMCRDAYGSVLFIDEAYSLYRGNDDTKDFGREALDTLIAQMENHRTDLVVILAGYERDMEKLMEGNSGLSSRIPYTIKFRNYRPDELFAIFEKLLSDSFPYDKEVLDVAKKYFESIPEEALNSKEFANARFVRNLFERTWSKSAMRSRLTENGTIRITAEDFNLATSEREFKATIGRKNRSFGFR